jgi:hypothetical protein
MVERRVVLPALSRPRRRMEYSGERRRVRMVDRGAGRGAGRGGEVTFFGGSVEVEGFG